MEVKLSFEFKDAGDSPESIIDTIDRWIAILRDIALKSGFEEWCVLKSSIDLWVKVRGSVFYDFMEEKLKEPVSFEFSDGYLRYKVASVKGEYEITRVNCMLKGSGHTYRISSEVYQALMAAYHYGEGQKANEIKRALNL